jgi:transcriptional regulator with XRE-family HTH domain
VGEDFHTRLKTARLRSGLKAKELAKICGISASYLSELESGKRSNPAKLLLEKLASECGVSVATLTESNEFRRMMPSIVRETRAPYGTPPADICRLPETCDLPARLDALEKGMDDIRTLLVSLLAEERSRHAPPDTVSKAG